MSSGLAAAAQSGTPSLRHAAKDRDQQQSRTCRRVEILLRILDKEGGFGRPLPEYAATSVAYAAATGEERAQGKRRLIKGPRKFRELRGNQPTSKRWESAGLE
jgi:hypothetical protein